LALTKEKCFYSKLEINYRSIIDEFFFEIFPEKKLGVG